VNTSPPTITGVAKRDHVLTGHRGEWTVDEPPIEYAYRWLRCPDATLDSCAPIAGETGSTYVPTRPDKAGFVRFEVTASATGGETVATSEPLGIK
jgi:hypothetical protein